MKCPTCKKEMKSIGKGITNNGDQANLKHYEREMFHCDKDDVWISIETPKENRV